MSLLRTTPLLLALFTAALGAERPAFAQAASGSKGQALLDEGVTLMDAGKVAQGCAKLEESQKLEPGMKTQFRLAQCYEKLGKLGAALALYRDVVAIAHKANRPDKEDFARKSADAIDARVPRFTIVVPAEVAAIPGIAVMRDGEAVGRSLWGVMVPVDPGEHAVVVTAPGKTGWKNSRPVGEGAKIEVRVPLLDDAPVTTPVDTPKPKDPVDASEGVGKSRKAIVITGIATSVAAIGLGAGFAGVSQQKASESHDLEKQGTSCTSECRAHFDGLQQDRARFANVAAWSFLAAGAIGGGTLIYGLVSGRAKPAKASAVRVVPLGAGAALVGVW